LDLGDAHPKRLRLLVLAPFPPQASGRHGGARAIAGAMAALAQKHEVGVLYLPDSGSGDPDDALVESCAFVEALPLERHSGARHWLRRLSVDAALLRGVPMWASELASREAVARVADVAAAFRPDVVQVEYLPMAVFLNALRDADAPKVLVDYDASLRPAREFEHLPPPLRQALAALDVRAWRRFEHAAASRVDATVVLTERDRRVMECAGGRRIVRIPFVLPARDRPLSPLGRPPWTVLFVGYYRHPPNADAARWLVQDIFPRVRSAHPDVTLVLVGADPPSDLRGLEHEGVLAVGPVEDITDYLDRAAVVVAPLRTGGGIRVKVLEALGAGKAVVATSLAAEGIEVPSGDGILLAETDAEFVDCISLLLSDEQRRQVLAAAAFAWAHEHQRWDAAAAQYDRLYAELLA
jgi:glycosyltransferase involved in cell wall biosynthesis